MIKNIITSLLYFFLIIIISTIFLTIFNYFNILNDKLIAILKLLIPIISILISSFILGKKTNKKGYIEGLKLGLIVISIFTAITLLLKELSIKSIIYHIIILLTSILGSMLGINNNKITSTK